MSTAPSPKFEKTSQSSYDGKNAQLRPTEERHGFATMKKLLWKCDIKSRRFPLSLSSDEKGAESDVSN